MNLARMLTVCISFESVRGVVAFSHDYGGAHLRQRDEYGPRGFWRHGTELPKGPLSSSIWTSDPLESFIHSIEAVDVPKLSHGPPFFLEPARSSQDPFCKLPMEILQAILIHLRSPDVLNLKLASRTIANTPPHDRFWYSRFCPQGEFRHCFEFERYEMYSGRWETVLRAVRGRQPNHSLVNRKRIWDPAAVLHHLLSVAGLAMVLLSALMMSPFPTVVPRAG
ncbi:hypothetical protein F5Y17DRAFT_137756 [Xylariaceae sp. FL0594]|nr:hypothetical protein F5Y17DRAFT_137756 [Xylariaceae sp. FL0594]